MKEKICYALIVLLVILSGFLTYKVLTDKPTEEKVKEEEKKEKFAFKKIETNGDKIVEYFDSNLNGTAKTIRIEFTHERLGDHIYSVTGKQNGTVVYSREYSEDLSTFKISDIFNEEVIKKGFTTQNLDTLKGTENLDYLIV